MVSMSRGVISALLVAVALTGSVGRSMANEPRPVGLFLFPTELTLPAGASHSLRLTLTADRGLERDVARDAQWLISPTDVASIDSSGTLRALKQGEATVTASADGHTAT